MGALRSAIEQQLARETGGPVEVERITPLVGGACQDNFRVELRLERGALSGRHRLVLRSDALGSLPGSLGRSSEHAVIRAATAHGVRTPRVHWLIPGLVRAGADAYFMDWIEGEAIGAKILRDPKLAGARQRLPEELAAVLAKIHAIDPSVAPELKAALGDPAALEDGRLVDFAIRRQLETLDAIPEPHPGLELALRWLREHPPASRELTLVHGDFRTGNFMVAPQGLSGVLDWEFAHWGNPFEDLAWLCVRDWRFGNLKEAAGGLCRREVLYAEYERASGRKVRAEDVHFWEIMGNVRWALGAVAQGQRYLKGGEADLELVAIARRAVEMEFEALRLIEHGPSGSGSTR